MAKKNERYVDIVFLEDEYDLMEDSISNKNIKDITIDKINKYTTFEDCIFTNVTFPENLEQLVFINCKFDSCELSNVRISDSGIHKSLFINSRLVGINIYDSKISNTTFDQNNMKYSNIKSVDIKNVLFNENVLIEASLGELTIKDIELISNDLTKVEIIDTKMKGIDVTSNKIDNMIVRPEDIKGMIVDEVQAITLIHLLGLEIK